MPETLRQNPINPCRACVTRELAITSYVEMIAALEAECAGYRGDLAHCGELITAAVEALHRAHVRARTREEQYTRLLEEVRLLRLLVPGHPAATRAA